MECCCGKLLIILFGTHSFALIFNCCLGFELPVESDDDISNSVVVKDRGGRSFDLFGTVKFAPPTFRVETIL